MTRLFPVIWVKESDGSEYAHAYFYPNASSKGLLRTAQVTEYKTRPCGWTVTEHRPEEYYHHVASGEAETLDAAKEAAAAYLDS